MMRIERTSWVRAAAMNWAMTTHAGTYSGGSGTAADPYQIGTVADWTEFMVTTNDLGKHFRLTADLDFDGADLTPVGTDDEHPFTGTFDGYGHVLRNAEINLPGNQFVGIFGVIRDSEIRNLGVENISVIGSDYVGGLVAWLDGGTSCRLTNWVPGGRKNGSEISRFCL